MKRAGWTRLSAPGSKLDACWAHTSGWQASHCGHPTANYPWSLRDPRTGKMTVSQNGYAFRTLEGAMRAAEAVLACTSAVVVPSAGEHPRIMDPDEFTAFHEHRAAIEEDQREDERARADMERDGTPTRARARRTT